MRASGRTGSPGFGAMRISARSAPAAGASLPGYEVATWYGIWGVKGTRRDVLDRMMDKRKEGELVRVYAGYSGWAAGQLDGEVARGDWHVFQADVKTIFDKKSDKIWPELIRRGSELQVRDSRRTLIL